MTEHTPEAMKVSQLGIEHHGWLVKLARQSGEASARTILLGGVRRWAYRGIERVGLLDLDLESRERGFAGTEYSRDVDAECEVLRKVLKTKPRAKNYHTPEAQPLHTAEEMPTVLRQMAKYDPMREAVLTEAADHIDGLLAGRASMVETVTTEAEKEALPVGSVIRTSGEGLGGWGPPRVAEKVAMADGSLNLRQGKWQVADGDEFEVDSDELDDLPAVVLFRPDREEGQ